MTNIGQAARSRSARIRGELAKRGQIETRVERTTDLAEGDRERIANLEAGMAELSRRIDQLKENSAIPVVTQDGGDFVEISESVRELQTAVLDFMKLAMSLDKRIDRVAHESHQAAAEAGALNDAGLRAVRGR